MILLYICIGHNTSFTITNINTDCHDFSVHMKLNHHRATWRDGIRMKLNHPRATWRDGIRMKLIHRRATWRDGIRWNWIIAEPLGEMASDETESSQSHLARWHQNETESSQSHLARWHQNETESSQSHLARWHQKKLNHHRATWWDGIRMKWTNVTLTWTFMQFVDYKRKTTGSNTSKTKQHVVNNLNWRLPIVLLLTNRKLLL